MKESVYFAALGLHIAGGYIALLSGIVIMLRSKGDAKHKRLGRVYFFSMMAVTASAVGLALFRGNIWLLQIALFVFYQAVAGFRSARLRNAVWKRPDVLLSAMALVNGFWMLRTGGAVLLVFGAICVFLALNDMLAWVKVVTGRELSSAHWLRRHIGMMVGAWIGTLTAFLVVNASLGDWNWILWLAPTMVMVPVMQSWIYRYTRGKKNMIGRTALLALLLFAANTSRSQPYVAGGNTRHRFAQLCVGGGIRHFGAQQTVEPRLDESGRRVAGTLPPLHEGRLTISGTHFWGHADFYMTFPLTRIGSSPVAAGVETGFRVMPWRLRSGRLSPFAGAGWMPVSYRQGAGAVTTSNAFPLSAGAVFTRGRHLFDLGVGYSLARQRDYYVTPTGAGAIRLNSVFISAGYRLMLETTAGAERDWKSGRTKKITDTLGKAGRLDGWTIGLGPSTSFFVKPSVAWQRIYPYAGRHYAALVFPELSFGYYWHRPDVQVSAVFRLVRSETGGFGYRQQLQRTALTWEGYHFFADYHGFVPFAGPAVSLERWSINDHFPGRTRSVSRSMVAPGVTFGWDIRPNRLQFFYLRTALRWFPFLEAENADGIKLALDQLEVNFIQLVLLPGRFRG